MGDYAGARAQYDKVHRHRHERARSPARSISESRWCTSGKASRNRDAKLCTATLEQARRLKEPYAQFEAGRRPRAAFREQRASRSINFGRIEASIQKPVAGMGEPDRNLSLASVLREEAGTPPPTASRKLRRMRFRSSSAMPRSRATLSSKTTTNPLAASRSSRQGDFANAADELTTDPHSPIALQQLALGTRQTRRRRRAPKRSARA